MMRGWALPFGALKARLAWAGPRRLRAPSVTNVVVPTQRTALFDEESVRMTTFAITGANKFAQRDPSSGVFAKKFAQHATNADFGPFFVRRANFSRTGSCEVATLKPMTPLQPLMQASMKPPSPMLAPEQRPLKPPSPMLAPEQRQLKPPSPLQPKNAPKTPVSHPQRRWRFHLGLSLREQR